MEPALVIDIGNTSVSLGLYRGGKVSRVSRIETARSSYQEIRKCLRPYATAQAVVASVVPHVNPIWHRALRRPTLWLTHTDHLGVQVKYPSPATIGADRLANACGAVARYGAPAIVADFGTAVTFDVITKEEGYVGGIIAPGLPLMFSYLAEKTAKLPHLTPVTVSGHVGKSTAQAMQLGARWGYRGMVREIVAELRKCPRLRRARLIATGGYASWVVRGLKPSMIVDPELTLYGLGRAFELNPHDPN